MRILGDNQSKDAHEGNGYPMVILSFDNLVGDDLSVAERYLANADAALGCIEPAAIDCEIHDFAGELVRGTLNA